MRTVIRKEKSHSLIASRLSLYHQPPKCQGLSDTPLPDCSLFKAAQVHSSRLGQVLSPHLTGAPDRGKAPRQLALCSQALNKGDQQAKGHVMVGIHPTPPPLCLLAGRRTSRALTTSACQLLQRRTSLRTLGSFNTLHREKYHFKSANKMNSNLTENNTTVTPVVRDCYYVI